jgi:MtaA/CmuA family methyltransferase
MNGRQRFLCALGRGTPDAPPVFLRDLTLGLDETGYSTPEVCGGAYDPCKAAGSVIALYHRLGQDAVVGCIHFVGMEVEALGGEVAYPERGIPSVTMHPYQNVADPDLRALDLRREAPFPNVLECYRQVSSELGKSTAIVCNLEGPLTKAALLRGMENLALDLHFDPGLAMSYVRYATELSKDYLREVVSQANIDCAFVAAASDNPDIFGGEVFRRYTIPQLSGLREMARENDLPTVFHPHGDLSSPDGLPLMEELIDTGIEGFQFAEGNDERMLKERFSERLALLGGIDAFSTLLLGPKERIVRETEGYLRTFHPWKGYVFMCSCSLHRGMPLEHVDLLMHCLRSYAGR